MTIPFQGFWLARFSIATKITLSVLAMLAAGIITTASILLYEAQVEMQETAQETLAKNMNVLRHFAYRHGEARIEGGKLYFGQTPANGNLAIVDQTHSLVGGVATIFMGDVRVATTVLNPDGSRAHGTRLTSQSAQATVFQARKPYSGEASVLGVPHLTVYEPIIDKASGQVIGMLSVGMKRSEFFASIAIMIRDGIIAATIVLILSAGLSTLLVRRSMKPFATLGGILEKIAAGDLSRDVPLTGRTDESGKMAGSVAILLDAARQKVRLEEETRQGSLAREEERRQAEEARRKAAEVTEARSAEQARILTVLGQGLSALSAGNLAFRIEEHVPVEYETLRDDFNRAFEKLSTMVSVIQSTADNVRTSAHEIRSGAGALSQRTEEQAHALQETAATSEEMSANVNQTALLTKQSTATATTALAAARRGGDVAERAIQAMAAIETASGRISDIIDLIDDIAFQTNLLALNASVEAARAGESGKGFAVVAAEVRMLAQRSAEAARDVATLISATNTEVVGGVSLVTEVGKALRDIVTASEQVATTMGQIASATEEQAHGIQEMTRTVAQIDNTTQQNAALSEESAASATQLSKHIDELSRLISAFRTSDRPPPLRRVA